MSLLRSQFKRIVIAQTAPAVRSASYSFSPVQRMKEENEVAKRKVFSWFEPLNDIVYFRDWHGRVAKGVLLNVIWFCQPSLKNIFQIWPWIKCLPTIELSIQPVSLYFNSFRDSWNKNSFSIWPDNHRMGFILLVYRSQTISKRIDQRWIIYRWLRKRRNQRNGLRVGKYPRF